MAAGAGGGGGVEGEEGAEGAERGAGAGAGGDGPAHGLQPEDLNTDGIDPSGHDVCVCVCECMIKGISFSPM